MTATTDKLAEQVAALTNEVEALKHAAAEAREQARSVVNPASPYAQAAAAAAREAEAHEAWRQSRGYGVPASPQVQLERGGDAYERAVQQALQCEAEQKSRWIARNVANAARRAAAGVQEPDAFARASSSAARQRAVETERRMRVSPVIGEALSPVSDLR
jgi:hypothetical protein